MATLNTIQCPDCSSETPVSFGLLCRSNRTLTFYSVCRFCNDGLTIQATVEIPMREYLLSWRDGLFVIEDIIAGGRQR